MKVINNIHNLTKIIKNQSIKNKAIGFIPTMGALHEGHLSLIQKARKENDTVIVSIFVNPKQFNNAEDFEKYPQTLDRDKELIRDFADIIFAPEVGEMYPQSFGTNVHISPLATIGEGSYRPGHFDGMATVVLKLFNIVGPTRAYFGKKDYQQLSIVKQMVSDLNLPISVIGCETVREQNGLAMSSRNMRLSQEGRERASVLYRALQTARSSILQGERTVEQITRAIRDQMSNDRNLQIEYVEVRTISDFQEVETITQDVILLLAVYIEGVRLIDNIEVFVNEVSV